MHIVYIGIGTNLEPRLRRMSDAYAAIERLGVVEMRSSMYETAPQGYTEQPNFLNSVVMLGTKLPLETLHGELKKIEIDLGRKKRSRWHEREIDFDILFFDDEIVVSDDLTVPHSEIKNRSFVLVPLNEIAAEFVHPVLRKSISELLDELTYEENSISRCSEATLKT